MYRKGVVYFNNNQCGLLEETMDGFKFTYDLERLKSKSSHSISLTLPLREEAYLSPILFPFFDGLIPEGWLLEIAVKHWKLDYKDRMGLLLKTGEDTIGAVTIKEF